MHLPLHPLGQLVPVSPLGPQVLSLLQSQEDRDYHRTLGPPATHDNTRGLRYIMLTEDVSMLAHSWLSRGFISTNVRLQTVPQH